MLCILVLLLINASYRSLGVPISPIANSLTALINNCENAFLSNQIKSKINDCTELAPHNDKQLHCLMFYDINKQLCSAVSTAKLALNQDYTAKINEEQDVNSLCASAQSWMFSNLSEFSHYKQAADKIFKNSVACGKICGVEDFMSDDANFFCKYFKWGEEMLNNHVSPTYTQGTASKNLVPETSFVDKTLVSQQNVDLQDVQIVRNNATNDNKSITPVDSSAKIEESSKSEVKLPETSSLAINSLNAAPAPGKQENLDTNAFENNSPLLESPSGVNEKPSKAPENTVSNADTAQENAAIKPDLSDNTQIKLEDSLKSEVDKELQLMNNEQKEPVLEGPKVKPQSDLDPDIDAEDAKDSVVGDDGDVGDVGEGGDGPLLSAVDTNPEVPKQDKKTETIVSTFSGEKDYYTNPAAQDVYSDGDDHFFQVFLTAIVLVVLLYILYHNKNKVSKVFFGLVLEGRQSARRRHSRGHSYRRLDTLEQAMSAGATAPPTKIIY